MVDRCVSWEGGEGEEGAAAVRRWEEVVEGRGEVGRGSGEDGGEEGHRVWEEENRNARGGFRREVSLGLFGARIDRVSEEPERGLCLERAGQTQTEAEGEQVRRAPRGGRRRGCCQCGGAAGTDRKSSCRERVS